MTRQVNGRPRPRVGPEVSAVSSSLICGTAVVVVDGALPRGSVRGVRCWRERRPFRRSVRPPVMQPTGHLGRGGSRVRSAGSSAVECRSRHSRRGRMSCRRWCCLRRNRLRWSSGSAGSCWILAESPATRASRQPPTLLHDQATGAVCPQVSCVTPHTENHVGPTSISIGPARQQRGQRFTVADLRAR